MSNFTKAQVEAILKVADIRSTINQLEYLPYDQNDDLIPWLRKSQKVMVYAFAALAPIVRLKPGPLDSLYSEFASKYGVSEGDIALRWVLDRGFSAATTGSNMDRLRGYQNASLKLKLTEEEIEQLRTIGLEKK